MHPHWLATDEGTPVPVRGKLPTKAAHPVQASTVSRRPAAILGVLLTLGIGAVVYGLFDRESLPLPGQVTPMGEFITEDMMPLEGDDETSPPETAIALESDDSLTIALAEDDPEGTVVRRTAQGVPSDHLSSMIPVNPHAAGTEGTPLPANTQAVSSDVIDRMHSGAPQPPYQPTTGSGMVLATLMGALTLLMVLSRRLLRA